MKKFVGASRYPSTLLGPVRLHRVDDADDPAVLALVGVRAALAALRELLVVLERHGLGAAADRHVDAEQREHDHHEDRPDAAADGHAAPATATPPVTDLAGVELCSGTKAHAAGPAPITGRARSAVRPLTAARHRAMTWVKAATMLIREPLARGVVLPGVFRPRSDTWLLARSAARQPITAGARILELCAGPAFAGIAAARAHRGTLVTVDVSRRAVLNARVNALANRVAIDARRGDLLAAVAGERFDLILANPPYVPGEAPPRRGAARAWEAGADGRAVLDRICAEAPRHLAPGGALLLVHSEFCGTPTTLRAYAAHGLRAEVVARERGPLGPLMRASMASSGQDTEDIVVARGKVPSS